MSRPRGACSGCGYRFPLRKDGTLQAHQLYEGWGGRRWCDGGHKKPEPEPPFSPFEIDPDDEP
jgi:hypothetical protein